MTGLYQEEEQGEKTQQILSNIIRGRDEIPQNSTLVTLEW